MPYRRSWLLGGTILAAILVVGWIPAEIGASTAGPAVVAGRIRTIDLAAREVMISRADGSPQLLSVPAGTWIRRNRGDATLAALALGDDLLALCDPRTGRVIHLTAHGTDVSQNNGAIEDVLKLTGDIQVDLWIFKAGAETKIVRNGQRVPLNYLTRRDSAIVHARPDSNDALDVIGQGPDVTETEGTVAALDAAGRTLTVAPDNGTPAIILAVDDAAMVEISGCPAHLSDLGTGAPVTITYSPSSQVALCIGGRDEGDERSIRGTVAGTDVAAGTITITPSDGGETVTLSVTAATDIEVNGVHGSLSEVTAGLSVWVRYNVLTSVAQKIEAGDREDCEHRQAFVEGSVAAVGSGGITINPADGSAPVDLTVDAATRIRINGWPGRLVDIEAGDAIKAKYDPATMVAIKLRVRNDDEWAKIEGKVTVVDAAGVTILDHGSSAAVSLTVDASTLIWVDGKTATIADISADDLAWALYDKTTLVALRLWINTRSGRGDWSEVTGQVTVIGLTGLTIQSRKDGSLVSLTVDASTEVKIQGKPGTLVGIEVGDRIEAFYDAETMIARKLCVDRDEDEERWASVEGEVTAVGTLSLTIASKCGGSSVTLTVDSSTEISVNGKPAALGAVKAGNRVAAFYVKQTLAAVKLAVTSTADAQQWVWVSGKVSAVGSDSVTIAPTSGAATVTVKVGASTEIRIDGRPGALKDIKTGYSVEAKYEKTSLLAKSLAVKTR